MSVVRAALTRRWLGILALTVAFAVACVALGQWQFARRIEAQTAIALLNANYDKEPETVENVLNSPTTDDPALKWTPIELTGKYLDCCVFYVRNRVSGGAIGFEQVVPFRSDSGAVVVINRGWTAANGDYSAPIDPPAVPSGSLTIVARLMPSEKTIDGRSAPNGQFATINVPTILGEGSDAIDVPYLGWYARIDSESIPSELGRPWERPVLDEGPHLSYALQWYVFAIMGFVGYGWALLRENAENNDRSAVRAVRKRTTDEDIEDAALDAAQR